MKVSGQRLDGSISFRSSRVCPQDISIGTDWSIISAKVESGSLINFSSSVGDCKLMGIDTDRWVKIIQMNHDYCHPKLLRLIRW